MDKGIIPAAWDKVWNGEVDVDDLQNYLIQEIKKVAYQNEHDNMAIDIKDLLGEKWAEKWLMERFRR